MPDCILRKTKFYNVIDMLFKVTNFQKNTETLERIKRLGQVT